MTPAWAQRQAAWLRACLVSPAVFMHMVDRLCECVVPSQQAFEPEAAQRNVPLYLQGLLSHLPRTNAEDMAALVAGARLVIQEFSGTAPWEHRALVRGWVGQGGERVGAPDGIIAFDPRRFPKRGTPSVGVQRPWCGHRGQLDHCQGGVYMGSGARPDLALLAFRLSRPEDWARDEPRRQACHGPPEVEYHTRPEPGVEMLDAWGHQIPHGWVTGDDERGRHTRGRHDLRERGARSGLGLPGTTTMRDLEAPWPT
jgi:SRSO17 transposase